MRIMWAHLLLSVLFVLTDRKVILANDYISTGQTIKDTKGSIQRQQLQSIPVSGSVFTLKVHVNEIVSCRHLNHATVDVYVNYTKTNSALTGEDGVVLLHVPFHQGLTFTIAASMGGYILTPMSWKTTKIPTFSSVTLSLFPLHQGNIWLFEDSVLITSDILPKSGVQFPKSLLNVTDSEGISSVRAYLTVPNLFNSEDRYICTMGLLISRLGYSSVELNPLAAISVQLFFNDREIQVSGPIQISLPLPDNSGLKVSDSVLAWFYNHTTGAWMNRGIGLVKMVKGRMMWTFNAPHLGYWIAASLPKTNSYIGLTIPTDFISQQTFFLMTIMVGTLIVLIGVLCLLLCCHRGFLNPSKGTIIHSTKSVVSKIDQTTSTHDNELYEVSSQDPHQRDWSNQLVASEMVDDLASSMPNENLNIYVEDELGLTTLRFYNGSADNGSQYNIQPLLHWQNDPTSSELLNSPSSEQVGVPLFLKKGVYILHTSGIFNLQQPMPSKLVTLARKGSPNTNSLTEAVSKDNFTQTLARNTLLCQNQGSESEAQPEGQEEPQGSSSTTLSWGHHSNLPESVSVPRTLNNLSDSSNAAVAFSSELQGNSQQALADLSKLCRGNTPSPQPPRAWFVSLEGKPAAEIHHSTIDAQRRRRTADSRDTSLDSGVDMSEPNQIANRKLLTLERDRTFTNNPPQKNPYPRDQAGLWGSLATSIIKDSTDTENLQHTSRESETGLSSTKINGKEEL